jgi:hypothetical protein
VEHTYNPIQEVDRPSFGLFKRAAPRPGYALVLHREGHPLVVMRRPEERMTLGEAYWSNYLRLYWVDLGEHAMEIACPLPADTDAFTFSAVVHLRCAVDDPESVIELNVTDVRAALEPRVVDLMRGVSRGFPVERSAEAEQEIARTLREDVGARGFCRGVSVSVVSVKLDLEEAARRHVRELKEHERRHQADARVASLRHEREMDEARLQHEREVEAARRRHEVEMEESARRHRERMRQLEQDTKHAQLAGELELLRAQLEIQRSQQYLPLIQEGNWALLSLFLAQHPERLSEVISVMMGQQQLMLDKQIETLRFFLDKDVVEKSDFEDRGRQLLGHALEQLSAGATGRGTAAISPKLLLEGAGAAAEGPAADGAGEGGGEGGEPSPAEPGGGAAGADEAHP